MKKVLSGVLVLLLSFFIKLPMISAACNISVSAPSNAVVGQTFKVSATVSSNSGSWEYTLSYDSSKVKLVSGQLHVVGVVGDSRTNTYTFKSLTGGATSFKAVNASIIDNNSLSECFSGSNTSTVTMKTQAEIEAGYSKNNNLSSLSVEGAELSPNFSANVLEYSTTLKPDTTKAIIKATAQDNTATIEGIGEIDVVDGVNKVEVVVTAQHGEKKTYVINITVEELDPIKVKLNGKEYTVIRKSGIIEEIPQGFTETKIKMNDQEITAYENKSLNLVLVGLKDSKGNASLYIYNKNSRTYSAFNNVSSGNVNLLVLDKVEDKVPCGFTKTNLKYNKLNLSAYKFNYINDKDYYLVYAMNLEDGNKAFYLYDKAQNTFQRYYEKYDSFKNNLIIYLSGVLVVIIILFLLKILKRIFTSKKRKIKKLEKKLNKLKNSEDEYFGDEESDEEPVIKKVEEDEYELPKKSRKAKRKELIDAKNFLDKDKTSIRRVSLEPDDMDDYDL